MKIHITIEPGKFTGAVIEWIGNHRRTSAVFMVLLSFVALWAAPITKPHTFSNGGIVSASEMNANFDTLYTKVNALDAAGGQSIYFPDSNAGAVAVAQSISTSPGYTVPAGQTFYLTTIFPNTADLNIDGVRHFQGSSATHKVVILMAKENSVLTTASGSAFIAGFTVPKSAEIITTAIDTVGYTVPAGKQLFLIGCSGGGTLVINTTTAGNCYGTSGLGTIVLPSSAVVKTLSGTMGISGYLR